MANMEQFGKPQTLPPLSNTARQALNLAEGLGAPGARATAARDVMELGNATIDRVKADQQARQAIKEQRKAQHAQKWQGRQAARGIDRAALQQRIAELMANRNTSAGPMGVPGGAGGLLGLRR